MFIQNSWVLIVWCYWNGTHDNSCETDFFCFFLFQTSVWDGDVGEAWPMSQTNEIVSDRRLLLLCVKAGIRFIRACRSAMLRPLADGAGASRTAATVSQEVNHLERLKNPANYLLKLLIRIEHFNKGCWLLKKSEWWGLNGRNHECYCWNWKDLFVTITSDVMIDMDISVCESWILVKCSNSSPSSRRRKTSAGFIQADDGRRDWQEKIKRLRVNFCFLTQAFLLALTS